MRRSDRIRFQSDGQLDPRSSYTKFTRKIMADAYYCLKADSGSQATAEKIITEAEKKLAGAIETERIDTSIVALAHLLNKFLTAMVTPMQKQESDSVNR